MWQQSGGANGSGICTPTDLGTYNDSIKPCTSVNNVFYSLHACVWTNLVYNHIQVIKWLWQYSSSATSNSI
jgi:hypothetical protein